MDSSRGLVPLTWIASKKRKGKRPNEGQGSLPPGKFIVGLCVGKEMSYEELTPQEG